jgi:hypothetical protein
MKLVAALLWFLVMLIIGAVIWLALFSVIIIPLAAWMPSADSVPISLVLLVLLLVLPGALSAAASTRVWRKRFCRFGKWIGLVPPVLLTLALLLISKQAYSRLEAVFAVMLSFVIGLAAANYTNRACSIKLNNKSRSQNE